MSEFENKRKHPRFDCCFQVNFGEGLSVENIARADNSSLGGLFIVTKEPFKPGTKILAHLYLPQFSSPVVAACEVAWSKSACREGNPSGMGVRFLDIDMTGLDRLDSFLQSRK